MKTVRRLLHQEIWVSVGFVALAFLTLFAFFELADELGDIGKGLPEHSYRIADATIYTLLRMPGRLYELLPISVLIGTIFVMARFAQSSEYTILRTSGMGPWRALKNLVWVGVVFTLVTFVVGDYVAPQGVRAAELFKAKFFGNISVGQTGAWLKDRQQFSNFAINVGSLANDGSMRNVKLFEFNSNGQIISSVKAERAEFAEDGWRLLQVQRNEFFWPESDTSANKNKAETSTTGQQTKMERSRNLPEWRWPTDLSAEMVSVALLIPERMGTIDLFQYVQHLKNNDQTAQRYEIEFWRKVFYPISCIVMVVLALPFAYLHFRSGAISGYVFLGVLIGISFFLLNNVFGYAGTINNWTPWITAAVPGFLYMLASLCAFTWLVLRQ